LIFQERSNVKEACAKYDADIIKKDDEVRQLKEQVKELMDSLSSV
jgi:outer membrane protein TolC